MAFQLDDFEDVDLSSLTPSAAPSPPTESVQATPTTGQYSMDDFEDVDLSDIGKPPTPEHDPEVPDAKKDFDSFNRLLDAEIKNENLSRAAQTTPTDQIGAAEELGDGWVSQEDRDALKALAAKAGLRQEETTTSKDLVDRLTWALTTGIDPSQTKPATGMIDWLTRVVPESAAKNIAYMPKMIYDMIDLVTRPIWDNLVQKWEDPSRSQYADEKMMDELGKGLWGLVEGITEFTFSPIPLVGPYYYGKEKFKERWKSDPIGSLLAIVPIIGGGTAAIKRGALKSAARSQANYTKYLESVEKLKRDVEEALAKEEQKKAEAKAAKEKVKDGTATPDEAVTAWKDEYDEIVAKNEQEKRALMEPEEAPKPIPVEETKTVPPITKPIEVKPSKKTPDPTSVEELKKETAPAEPISPDLAPVPVSLADQPPTPLPRLEDGTISEVGRMMVREYAKNIEPDLAKGGDFSGWVNRDRFGKGIVTTKIKDAEKFIPVFQEWVDILGLDTLFNIDVLPPDRIGTFNADIGPKDFVIDIPGAQGISVKGVNIRIDPNRLKKVPSFIESMSHEFGHAYEFMQFVNAPDSIKAKVLAEYNRVAYTVGDLKRKGKGIEAGEVAGRTLTPYLYNQALQRNKKVARKVGMSEKARSRIFAEYTEMNLDMREYMASQVSRWIMSNEVPMTAVDKFFHKIGTVVRKFYGKVNDQFHLNKPLQDWLTEHTEYIRAKRAAEIESTSVQNINEGGAATKPTKPTKPKKTRKTFTFKWKDLEESQPEVIADVMDDYNDHLAKKYFKSSYDELVAAGKEGELYDKLTTGEQAKVEKLFDMWSEKMYNRDPELPDDVLFARRPGKKDTPSQAFLVDKETALEREAIYQDPSKQKALMSSIETFTMKLTNDINLFIHNAIPDAEVRMTTAAAQMRKLLADVEDYRLAFDSDAAFEGWVRTIEDASRWANDVEARNQVKRLGERKFSFEEYEKLSDADKIALAKEFDEYSKIVDTVKKGDFKTKSRGFLREVKRKTLDKSVNLYNDLIKYGKDVGFMTAAKMILARGGTTKAAGVYRQLHKEVFSGLNKQELRTLFNLIWARRTLAITGSGSKAVHPLKAGTRQSLAYLEKLEEISGLSKEQIANLHKKSNIYFTYMHDALKTLLDEGLITQADFDNMKDLNYQRRKLLGIIDPIGEETRVGTKRLTILDKGVDYLKRGRADDILEMDARLLALEVINRTYSRAFGNRANRELLHFAQTFPDNPIVREKKKGVRAPAGWKQIDVYVEGEKRKLFMPENYAREWVTLDTEMSFQFANIMRHLSGSSILRPMATGWNWAFAFANFPRDIMHAIMTSTYYRDGKWHSTYSPFLPKAMMQIGGDVRGVLWDSMTRKGKWLDAVDDGMGFEFLTGQGRVIRKGFVQNKWAAFENFMGYLGETSEIMTRLAIRDRMIKTEAQKRGISYAEAAQIPEVRSLASLAAREVIDFGQGGGFVKALDTAIPYLNAGVQGTRGLFRAMSRTPKEFTAKVIQLGILTTQMDLFNRYTAPEGYKNLSDSEKENNFIIMLPDRFAITKPDGEKVYLYLKIPMEHSQRFFKRATEYAIAKSLGEDIDGKSVGNALKALIPSDVIDRPLPPSLEAYLGYMHNQDFWNNEEIWKGRQVKPFAEFTPDTPEAAIKVGAATGLSPERLDYALSRVIPKSSVFSSLGGLGYDMMFRDYQPEIAHDMLALAVAKYPGASRFIGVTNPYQKYAQGIEDEQVRGNTFKQLNSNAIENMTEQMIFFDRFTMTDIIEAIEEVASDKEEAKRLVKQVEFQIAIKDLPEKKFWLHLQRLSPEDRARSFYKLRWKDAETDEAVKQQLFKEMSSPALKGLFSQRFWNEFAKVRASGGEVEELRPIEFFRD